MGLSSEVGSKPTVSSLTVEPMVSTVPSTVTYSYGLFTTAPIIFLERPSVADCWRFLLNLFKNHFLFLTALEDKGTVSLNSRRQFPRRLCRLDKVLFAVVTVLEFFNSSTRG